MIQEITARRSILVLALLVFGFGVALAVLLSGSWVGPLEGKGEQQLAQAPGVIVASELDGGVGHEATGPERTVRSGAEEVSAFVRLIHERGQLLPGQELECREPIVLFDSMPRGFREWSEFYERASKSPLSIRTASDGVAKIPSLASVRLVPGDWSTYLVRDSVVPPLEDGQVWNVVAADGGRYWGRVVGSDGNCICRAIVVVAVGQFPGMQNAGNRAPLPGFRSPESWRIAMTNEVGDFVIAGVPPGQKWRAAIYSPGYPPKQATFPEVVALTSVEVPVVRMEAGSNLLVRLVDADTRVAVENADVLVEGLPTGSSALTKEAVKVSGEGEARFSGLQEGRYKIWARSPGYAYASGEARVQGRDGSVSTVLLRRAGDVTLLVRDKNTREGVAGVKVHASIGKLDASTAFGSPKTDANGRCTLVGALGEDVSLTLGREGYVGEKLDLVAVGDLVFVDMEPPRRCAVRVVRGGGLPAVDEAVTVRQVQDDRQVVYGGHVRWGVLLLSELRSDTEVSLQIESEWGESALVALRMPDQDGILGEIELVQKRLLSVWVVGPSGNAVVGASVRASRVASGRSEGATAEAMKGVAEGLAMLANNRVSRTDSSGRCELRVSRNQAYRIEAWGAGYSAGVRNLDQGEGDSRIELGLKERSDVICRVGPGGGAHVGVALIQKSTGILIDYGKVDEYGAVRLDRGENHECWVRAFGAGKHMWYTTTEIKGRQDSVDVVVPDHAAVIEGRALDAGGTPLAGARVVLSPAGEAVGGTDRAWPSACCDADEGGGFVFPGVMPGRYVVVCYSRGRRGTEEVQVRGASWHAIECTVH